MATIVLTAVGTLVGGPLGGAIGAMIGQQIDQNILFKPKGSEGPRLQELAVQTSSYGSAIPRIYGRLRVAGTVIWATDLKEIKETSGGGKGKPKSTSYSYSVSFAVALSSRRVKNIGRIWADGKIFRGQAGDFKTPTGFRFVSGDEDQSADSLISSSEASGGTPAYRGIALAVFEDMLLADYGNRIPSLTFELIADNGTVSIGEIIADISSGKVTGEIGQQLIGYSANEGSLAQAITAIGANFNVGYQQNGDQYIASERGFFEDDEVANLSASIAAKYNREDLARPEYRTVAETRIPRKMSLRYYDPARDYQSGLQNAFRPGTSRLEIYEDFPAALNPDTARAVAEGKLLFTYQSRQSAELHVLSDPQLMKTGALVRLDDEQVWQIRGVEVKRSVAALSLMRAFPVNGQPLTPSDGGRAVVDEDALAGPTRLVLIDLPCAADNGLQVSDVPRVYAAATGGEGWRNAALYIENPISGSRDYAGAIRSAAVIGKTISPLGVAAPWVQDRRNMLEVELHRESDQLYNADDAMLSSGRNLAVIGGEIIQFAEAQPLGNRRFILSDLRRGLGGTEHLIAGHLAQENFVLIEPEKLTEINAQDIINFGPITVLAVGRDDEAPVSAGLASTASALKPLSPVHLNARVNADGAILLKWIRRSRGGVGWPDYIESPLSEESERYSITITADDPLGAVTVETTGKPLLHLQAVQVANYRSQGAATLTFEVRQLGTHTASEPVRLTVSL